ncbi:MAG: hypothetical protein B7Z15_00265 [Rhizobiales bacterium 32-66-8]|nr:MAG: hypothetical protein B7Z15_00265 [Rhizobiales bacterium 32-66-8]
MAKGYWIAFVDVSDLDAYKAYARENAVPFAKYGARFIVRAGKAEHPEGQLRSRTVVIEFPDYQTALDCWNSPEYAIARALRENVSLADIIIADGYQGVQPARP